MRLIDADVFKENMDYICDAGGWLEPVTKAVREFVKRHIDAQTTVKPEPQWVPCSEYPEYDFEGVLVRWHDKRKGCEDDYILCESYVVREHWCCIFEDADMSDYEPVEWTPISQRRMNHE